MSRMASWTGLFGSKSGKLKPDPKVRWLGKLPTYADYYSSRNDEEWTVEFNEWILEGFELYLNRSREGGGNDDPSKRAHGPRRLPLSGGAIRLPRSGMTVLTSIRDYGGDMVGRPFPMCFYVAAPTSLWPGPTSDRLDGAARVMRGLLNLQEEVIRYFNVPGDFSTRFGDRQIDLADLHADSADDAWLSAAQTLSMEAWYHGLAGEVGTVGLDAWLASVAHWGERISSSDADEFKPTLSFPLSGGVDLHVQAAGWLRWLERRMNLKRRSLSLLLASGSNGTAHRLMVIARETTAEDFLLLTPLASRLRYVDDLSKIVTPDEAGTGTAPVSATWAEFVTGQTRRA